MAAGKEPIDPATLTEDEAFALVRMGLFDLGTSPLVSGDQREMIEVHFLGALEKHIDLPGNKFSSWFIGHFNDTVRSIAKKAAVVAAEINRDHRQHACRP
ncbi:hypothetical protein BH11PLA2_BH11PLA2_37130 [soil metagenome]